MLTMPYKILPTSLIRMLRLLSQTRKTNPWMTRNILLLLRKRHRLHKRWRRLQNPVHKQLYNKIRNLVQRKPRLPKIALPITSPNDWTRSVKATLTFGKSWINTGNLLQIGPSLFYLMALPFSQTMIKATCSIISLRPYLLCLMSTYRFPHSLLKRMHASPQYTSNR